ncbi:MAG: hypothetical protein J5634_02225 [Bacilli bacterium]|nr:hypothetical protein [Bacilli bacterium]
MLIGLIMVMFLSFYITNMPYFYDGEGIYQINKLEYSYTSGYGMNDDVSYKIDCEEDCILVYKEYGKDEKDTITIKLNDKDMDKFENMLNRYHILSWKGFKKSDPYVLDGNSFSFHLRYNDDEKLSASGYMMYPNHYKEFQSHFEDYVDTIRNR